MKLWKKLAVCSVLALSSVAFSGCNCSRGMADVSVDLDGDGVVSDWEQIFEKIESSSRILTVSNIVEISSFDDLKAINEKTDESNYYKLTKNIDCNGEELNINLGKSVLFGNNKVIKNFKLKEIGFTTGDEQEPTHIDANVYGFIYNGVAVYDLRLFVGYQKIDIDNLYKWSYVSPLVNIPTIDNVTIKGKLDVKRLKTEGLSGDNKVDISMGVANLSDIGEYLDQGYYVPNISNIETIGVIDYTEETTNSQVRIGGVVSHLADNGLIYGAKSSVNISAYNTGTLCVGGIVGDNDDMVTTCEYSGEIKTTYDPNSVNYIGGIAGRNYANGELKNCVISGKISFDTSVTTSIRPQMFVGGAVGRNLGVVDYIENNCTMDISNAIDIQVGGICGSSEYGIFSNIINRANILLTKCQNVYIAEICGYSQYGRFEQIVDMSTIKVDNSEIPSNVRIGMVTIFEDFSQDFSVQQYNAEYAPTFYGILMTGSSVVNQKKVSESSNNFVYNLGLRNPYEYNKVDENGEYETTVKVDGAGKPVLDDDGNEIYVNVTATQLPDQFDKLFFLIDSFSIKKYTISADGSAPIQDVLNINYAKDEDSMSAVSERSNTRLNVAFFVRDLGFKYGLNHNELDLSGNDADVDLQKLSFSLNADHSLTKYFEFQHSNGDLAFFDNYFDEQLTYDEELDKKSEMYSYLNALMLSDTTQLYEQIKVSYAFASQQDLNNTDSTITLENNFARNVAYLIGLIVGVEPSIAEWSSNGKDIEESDENLVVKYQHLEVSDSNYRYFFTFQTSHMHSEDDSHLDNYIVNMKYQKTNKY